jgi:hypothetical protein
MNRQAELGRQHIAVCANSSQTALSFERRPCPTYYLGRLRQSTVVAFERPTNFRWFASTRKSRLSDFRVAVQDFDRSPIPGLAGHNSPRKPGPSDVSNVECILRRPFTRHFGCTQGEKGCKRGASHGFDVERGTRHRFSKCAVSISYHATRTQAAQHADSL